MPRPSVSRRRTLAVLGTVLTGSVAGCAAFTPESNLRDVPLELRNERTVPVQATLHFEESPVMVVDEDARNPTWTITAPAETTVVEDHQAQPGTYEPRIEVSHLQNDSVLHADHHEMKVPEPRGSVTLLDIIVTPSEVRVDIVPQTAV